MKKHPFFALILALFVFAAACLPVFLPHHDCDGGHCPVCAILALCRELYRLPVLCGAFAVSAATVKAAAARSGGAESLLTPVLLRVKLSR